ncbi:phage tail protein [Sphingobacterium yanglingense]|uniref:Microcystin-dependent protein n=1 Tax=Sphingobacterium yanglingense TaxID=1437280 RepID=A0A4R6W858_9SPHI|nr:tail fiber protein [Sphingobacterium yanglingense]TDQ73711.1 microcystin-dependent protein [Sphingobacterium yanglingense]
MEEYMGMIKMFGGNFAMRGTMFCNGQLVSLAQNTALFALLGTTFGGNGQTTFGLPDLRGRTPIGWGQGPGLSNYTLGQSGGVENVTLTTNQLPNHRHVMATSAAGNTPNPTNARLAFGPKVGSGPNTSNLNVYNNNPSDPTAVMFNEAVGNNQAFQIIQPYLAISYVVVMEGIFPSRN